MIIVSLVFSGAKLRIIIEMEALFAPAMSLKIGHTVFRRVGCRVPEPMTHKVVGQELLLHEMLGIVVGIFIVFAVAEFLHKGCGSVAYMQRNREIAALTHFGKRFIDRKVGGIALG